MKHFIPAARFAFLTPIYDLFSRTAFGGHYRKIAALVLKNRPGKILDLGCGPGNLIVELKKRSPETEIAGLDIDPEILKIAGKKMKGGNLKVRLIKASAAEIPLQEKFDAVTSTMMFHHLSTEDKKKALARIRAILNPGGKFYLLDFGPARNFLWKILSKIFRLFEEVDDAIDGKYPVFMKEAGFKVHSVYRTFFLELLEGEK